MILLVNTKRIRFLYINKIRIKFIDFYKIPLQIKGKLLYYILSNENNVIFLQIFLDFQKNSLVKLTKLKISKKIKKIKKSC